MTLVLDAGAFVAAERGDRGVWAKMAVARQFGERVVTVGPVVGQIWRGGPRQAGLARFLVAVDVLPVGDVEGRGAGELLGAANTSDVVDALVVLAATRGDRVITSDPKDISHLLDVAGTPARVIAV